MKLPRIALGLASLTLLAGCSDAPDNGGPLEFHGDATAKSSLTMQVEDGEQIVSGFNVVTNTGDDPVTLTDAYLEGDVPAEAAEKVEARALNPELTNFDILAGERWPYKNYAKLSEPINGFTVEPGAEVNIMIVVDVHKAGEHTWPATVVTYETTDGDAYEIRNEGFAFGIKPFD